MLLHNPEGDGKTQSRPGQFPVPGLIGTIETLEDSSLICKGDADARIGHR